MIHDELKVPEWVENMRTFDDDKQFDIIAENNQAITLANENISAAIERLNKNNEYKSILFTNGDELINSLQNTIIIWIIMVVKQIYKLD